MTHVKIRFVLTIPKGDRADQIQIIELFLSVDILMKHFKWKFHFPKCQFMNVFVCQNIECSLTINFMVLNDTI